MLPSRSHLCVRSLHSREHCSHPVAAVPARQVSAHHHAPWGQGQYLHIFREDGPLTQEVNLVAYDDAGTLVKYIPIQFLGRYEGHHVMCFECGEGIKCLGDESDLVDCARVRQVKHDQCGLNTPIEAGSGGLKGGGNLF